MEINMKLVIVAALVSILWTAVAAAALKVKKATVLSGGACTGV
jgi:hypothetical protein